MINKKNEFPLGVHVFGIPDSMKKFQVVSELGLSCMQIFTASNLKYALLNDLSDEYVLNFKKARERYPHISVYSHACYLLNLANPLNEIIYNKSVRSLEIELQKCNLLDVEGVVIHPGSNKDRHMGIFHIANTINNLFKEYEGSTKLYLESSAGQGNTLPTTIGEIKLLYNQLSLEAKKKTKLVIDTCHVHASGYDLSQRNTVLNFLAEYDKEIGMENVGLIHVNDSKQKSGSKIDRHENIGNGTIGLQGFGYLLENYAMRTIPKILETPVSVVFEFKSDIEKLKSLISIK